MEKQTVVNRYKGILAFIRRKILTDATNWIKLEDIKLSETNPSQKDKFCMIPLKLST